MAEPSRGQARDSDKPEVRGGSVIVTLASLRDIEEWIAQGWYCGRLDNRTPVQRRYGAFYVWRQA